jgi:DNA-binding response OmpR family regulator
MMRCLVVVIEDDRELGELVTEALAMELDCDLHLLLDGTEAMRWLSAETGENVPGLIILDMHLPGVSGLQILDYIRSQTRFDNTRVVVTTADSMLLEKARNKADWLLLKPVAYSHFAEISRWFRGQIVSNCERAPASKS